MPRLPRQVILAATVLAWSCPGHSDTEPKEDKPFPTSWSAELGVGIEYDSNVSVEEVDASASQGDYAMTLNAGLGLRQDLSETAELGLTYNFSQSIYDEFSQVDRLTNMFGADLGFNFARVDPALSVYYINSRLDGSRFLDLYRVSPSLSGFMAKKWFARGAYVYSDKTLQNRKDRDAKTNAGEADAYFFMRGLRQYFNLGYRFRHENARADRYDYQSNSVKLRYIHRFELLSRLVKLELAWRYEDRNYRSDTPSIMEKRDDQRNRVRLDLEIPVLENGAVQFFAGYAEYDSNYAPADYNRTLVGTRFAYSW